MNVLIFSGATSELGLNEEADEICLLENNNLDKPMVTQKSMFNWTR